MLKSKKIILYHGSDRIVIKPLLSKCRPKHDFGLAFYLTTSWNQAYRWAKNRARKRRYKRQPVVSKYEFNLKSLNGLNYKIWDNISRDWLDFIIENRNNQSIATKTNFDIVVGPVIDGKYSWDTLADYESGLITYSDAIHELHPENLRDQWAFKTQSAIDTLEFKGEAKNENN